MKKKLLVIIVIFCLIGLCGCKNKGFNNTDLGKVNYHLCGLYLEYEIDDFVVNDYNPKVYYSYNRKLFKADSGNTTYQTSFTNRSFSTKIENNVNILYLAITLETRLTKDKKIYIYHINEDINGNVTINMDQKDALNLARNNNYLFKVNYQFNKIKYQIQLSLKINVIGDQ